MKSDLNDLKKLTLELMKNGNAKDVQEQNEGLIQKIYGQNNEEPTADNLEILALEEPAGSTQEIVDTTTVEAPQEDRYHYAEEIQEEETLSLQEKELELIKKSLERHQGKRKLAAAELGISERTLYRKIKQYDL